MELVKTFLMALAYVVFIVGFMFGTAFLMAAGLWYIGIPVFILGLSIIVTVFIVTALH